MPSLFIQSKKPKSILNQFLIKNQSSFTLVELLIVIALIAVLAVAIIMTLNPAEMLKSARDSRRLEDLQKITKTIAWFEADTGGTGFMGASSIVYVSVPDSSPTCANLGLPSLPSGWNYGCAPSSTYQNTDGTGWIPINFNQMSFGKTLSKLPIDPINNTSTGNYYTYVAGGSFKLTTRFESGKYILQRVAKDGGPDPALYETGSNLSLAPFVGGMVGYWSFDEGQGTIIKDLSGYEANGNIIVNSSTYSWTTGKIGYAINWQPTCSTNCSSINSRVRVNLGRSISLAPGTIMAWAKPTGGNFFCVLRASDGTDAIGFDNRAWFSYDWQNGVWCNWNATDTWWFIAATYDGNIVRCYQNSIQTASAPPPVTTTPESFQYFNIATRNDSYADFFNGLIDEVRIYNRALSADEIQAIYNATK